MSKSLIGDCRLTQLSALRDPRGALIALEGGREVPFNIRRVYYLYGMDAESVRGFHAHRELQQLAVCVSGACTFILDDGQQRQEVRLDQPDVALHIGAMVWREMKGFTPDCVLMVLASEPYDQADYIRDYAAFLTALSEGDEA